MVTVIIMQYKRPIDVKQKIVRMKGRDFSAKRLCGHSSSRVWMLRTINDDSRYDQVNDHAILLVYVAQRCM